jgi:dolichol kinase
MSEGDSVASIAVRLLPHKLSFSSHVSTESRYGMCALLLLLVLALPLLLGVAGAAASAAMTRPSVVRLLLMLAPCAVCAHDSVCCVQFLRCIQ